MKSIVNKKGNGVVILTADEYVDIVNKVYQANNQVEYILGYLNEGDLNDEKIETIKTMLGIANDKLSKLNASL